MTKVKTNLLKTLLCASLFAGGSAFCQDAEETYGARFVDVRPVLVAAYDPAQPQDVKDHADDVVPASLRSDTLHLNSAGYKITAKAIHDAYLANQKK